MRTITTIIILFIVGTLAAQRNWITEIDDCTPVSQLAIPGTHDAATGNGVSLLFQMGITQSKEIDEQWNIGVRVFDLRPALDGEELHIYHGPLKTRISFSDAIELLKTKLESESPNEFAIVIIRNEKHSGNSEEEARWSRAIGRVICSLSERAAPFHPTITVGELRGKILFMSRNHYTGCDKGAYIEGWNHSPDGTTSAQITPYGNGGSARLMVQDFYDTTGDVRQAQKREAILKYLDMASSASPDTWCINHISGFASTYLGIAGLGSNRGYRSNATNMNRVVITYINGETSERRRHPRGIILMDFAGERGKSKNPINGDILLNAIIESNSSKRTKSSF